MTKPSVRVLTWNLWAPGPHRAHRTDVVIDELKRLRPDVALLQEVGSHVDGTGKAPTSGTGRSVAHVIAEATGMRVAHLTGDGDFDIQRAILTRLPILDEGLLELPVTPDGWTRPSVPVAKVRTPAGRTWVVASAHLPWGGRQEAARLACAQTIDAWTDTVLRPGDLAVLGGDFNANDDGGTLRWLTGRGVAPDGSSTQWADTFEIAGSGDPTTVSPANINAQTTAKGVGTLDVARIPSRRIDYVMVKTSDRWWVIGKPGMPLQTVVVGTAPAPTPAGLLCGSDHYGVLTDLWDPPL